MCVCVCMCVFVCVCVYMCVCKHTHRDLFGHTGMANSMCTYLFAAVQICLCMSTERGCVCVCVCKYSANMVVTNACTHRDLFGHTGMDNSMCTYQFAAVQICLCMSTVRECVCASVCVYVCVCVCVCVCECVCVCVCKYIHVRKYGRYIQMHA